MGKRQSGTHLISDTLYSFLVLILAFEWGIGLVEKIYVRSKYAEKIYVRFKAILY